MNVYILSERLELHGKDEPAVRSRFYGPECSYGEEQQVQDNPTSLPRSKGTATDLWS